MAEPTGRVVLVDDDQVILLLTAAAFEARGWEVAGRATTAEEAVAMVEDLLPDLAVVDYILEDIDGVEVAATIKERVPSCRVVMFTGRGDELIGSRIPSVDAVVDKDDLENLMPTVDRLFIR